MHITIQVLMGWILVSVSRSLLQQIPRSGFRFRFSISCFSGSYSSYAILPTLDTSGLLTHKVGPIKVLKSYLATFFLGLSLTSQVAVSFIDKIILHEISIIQENLEKFVLSMFISLQLTIFDMCPSSLFFKNSFIQ